MCFFTICKLLPPLLRGTIHELDSVARAKGGSEGASGPLIWIGWGRATAKPHRELDFGQTTFCWIGQGPPATSHDDAVKRHFTLCGFCGFFFHPAKVKTELLFEQTKRFPQHCSRQMPFRDNVCLFNSCSFATLVVQGQLCCRKGGRLEIVHAQGLPELSLCTCPAKETHLGRLATSPRCQLSFQANNLPQQMCRSKSMTEPVGCPTQAPATGNPSGVDFPFKKHVLQRKIIRKAYKDHTSSTNFLSKHQQMVPKDQRLQRLKCRSNLPVGCLTQALAAGTPSGLDFPCKKTVSCKEYHLDKVPVASSCIVRFKAQTVMWTSRQENSACWPLSSLLLGSRLLKSGGWRHQHVHANEYYYCYTTDYIDRSINRSMDR